MDLNELQSAQSRERQTDSLQQLRATFYQDAADYIQDLEDERDDAAERAADPWNAPEVGRLNDDIDTAKGTVEAIYERRVGKIVKMASLAAADMPTDDEGLTEEEQALFDQLVAAIEQNREGVFAILDGEDPAIDTTASTPSNAGRARQPTATEERSTPVADGSSREVPPDVGPPDEESVSDSDPSDEETPDQGVGAADLMGSGEDEAAGDSIAERTSVDADPGEAGSVGAETPSRDPPVDDVGTEEAETGQAVRDGGGTESRSPGSTSAADGPRAGTTDDATATGTDPGTTDDATATGTDPGTTDDAGPDESDPDSGGDDPDVDRAMVRITDDVGPIYGVEGREYDLTAEDVVTLPEANAGPLVKQGAAERLD